MCKASKSLQNRHSVVPKTPLSLITNITLKVAINSAFFLFCSPSVSNYYFLFVFEVRRSHFNEITEKCMVVITASLIDLPIVILNILRMFFCVVFGKKGKAAQFLYNQHHTYMQLSLNKTDRNLKW